MSSNDLRHYPGDDIERFQDWLNECPVEWFRMNDNVDSVEYRFILPVEEEEEVEQQEEEEEEQESQSQKQSRVVVAAAVVLRVLLR